MLTSKYICLITIYLLIASVSSRSHIRKGSTVRKVIHHNRIAGGDNKIVSSSSLSHHSNRLNNKVEKKKGGKVSKRKSLDYIDDPYVPADPDHPREACRHVADTPYDTPGFDCLPATPCPMSEYGIQLIPGPAGCISPVQVGHSCTDSAECLSGCCVSTYFGLGGDKCELNSELELCIGKMPPLAVGSDGYLPTSLTCSDEWQDKFSPPCELYQGRPAEYNGTL